MISQVPLKEVLSFHRGLTFKPEDRVEVGSPNSIVCFRTKNIQEELDESDLIAIPDEIMKRAELEVLTGDILISTANSWDLVGKCVRVLGTKYRSTLGGFISLLRPNHAVVNPDYLYRFLTMDSTQHAIRHLGKQTTNISNLDRVRFLEIKIPLPPLEIQKQIAAVLEKADQLRKDCHKIEQELSDLAQSVFMDMFGSALDGEDFGSLGDVAEVVSGVTKGQDLSNKETMLVPYMRVANVQAGYLNLGEIKEIEVKKNDVEKYRLKKGDVLLTEGGDFDKLGRGAIWEGQVEECIHQNHVFRVRLDQGRYLPEWFNGYLKTGFAKRYFLKCAKKTTNLASINITQLKALPLPNVSIDEQESFLKKQKLINEKMALNDKVAKEFDQVFNSLMQKAFKGELSVEKAAA